VAANVSGGNALQSRSMAAQDAHGTTGFDIPDPNRPIFAPVRNPHHLQTATERHSISNHACVTLASAAVTDAFNSGFHSLDTSGQVNE